jgi:two-component system, OmpR family, response regulator
MAALERILYAENEPDIQALALLSLEKPGKFTAQTCPLGQCAPNDAAAFGQDMILLDVMLPDMDDPIRLPDEVRPLWNRRHD